jgi:hypothetical protein
MKLERELESKGDKKIDESTRILYIRTKRSERRVVIRSQKFHCVLVIEEGGGVKS